MITIKSRRYYKTSYNKIELVIQHLTIFQYHNYLTCYSIFRASDTRVTSVCDNQHTATLEMLQVTSGIVTGCMYEVHTSMY
jgi:hypothetical protein